MPSARQAHDFILMSLLLIAAAAWPAFAQLTSSPSGHYVRYQGQPLMLVGESGTQCVTQNANLDLEAWVIDCASRGIRMVHVWAFTPPRQKQDGSLIEARWGYVYPGLTPWERKSSGLPAADQLPPWDLGSFDDGPDEDLWHYWPRLRALCRLAKDWSMVVGITVFTGWAKHQADWEFHPFNVKNGGHLEEVAQIVQIEQPNVEILDEGWSEVWSDARKTQWLWERFAGELLRQLNPFGNVFFVFFDEHSYPEGNLGEHFLIFFKKRGAVWMDWAARREQVDFVMSDTFSRVDKHLLALEGFQASPVRPFFLLEGEPYQGDDVRLSMWSFAMGGGHFTFHADTGQETVRSGIMGYDPQAPGADKGMRYRDWLGHLSRFFNEHVQDLDRLAPMKPWNHQGMYCLAYPGKEYVVYISKGGDRTFSLDLSEVQPVSFTARYYNPRTGRFSAQLPGVTTILPEFRTPDEEDWVLHLTERSS